MLDIGSVEDFDKTMCENKIAMVEFWAEWCASCKAFSKVLETEEKNYPQALFAKVNIEEVPDLALRYNVTSLPLLICFHDGIIHSQGYGAKPSAVIRSMIPNN